MAESPPAPPQPSIESNDLEPQNPNPTSESAETSEIHQPKTTEFPNPPLDPQDPPNPEENQLEEAQIVAEDQEQEDPDQEQEGMSVTLSPRPNSSNSDAHSALESKGNPPVSSARRPPKRKKPLGKKSQVALEKKLQTLTQNLNPIPFVPGKVLDFSRYEELLKKVGLWEFAHIEFDRNLRADLIVQLIVNYTSKVRGSYVNDCKIGVNRADLGRALKLPGKKSAGDCDGEEFPADFLSFLDEFVSNWMLLHGDLWLTPSEIMNWTHLIKDGHPEKVDWAGLVWFMVEKELSQGANLKDCYYASHLQQLIKVQKEELLRENLKVEVTVEDDDDGEDVKMLDSEDIAVGGERLEEQNVEVKQGQDCVAPMEIAGDGENVEKVGVATKMDEVEDAEKIEKVDFDVAAKMDKVEDAEKMEKVVDDDDEMVEKVDDAEKMEEVGNADRVEKGDNVGTVENAGDASHVETAKEDSRVGNGVDAETAKEDSRVGNAVDAQNTESVNEVSKMNNFESDQCVKNAGDADVHAANVDNGDQDVQNVDKVDEHVQNVDQGNEHVQNVDHVDEHVEVFDNTENAEEESKDADMMDFGYCKGDEQGQWLLDGRNDGGQHFLQRCSVADAKLSMEDRQQVEVVEAIKPDDVEDDGHVEGFRILQKGPLDGIPQANLMQAFEAGPLQYSSADLAGQPSLQLMSSRIEDNMMLGGPSMLNHAGKREIEHEHDIAHHALNDNHKKMRLDGSWSHKSSGFDMLMDQMLHFLEKAKMAHEAEKEEAYEQGSVNQQQFIAHEIARKDNEIMQLRCRIEELERRRQTETHRLDRELYLMNSVINGYRKALKDTQRAFAEFRKRCAVPDEPVYRDAGSGGVVKSIMELEKERIKQEEERKMICYFLEETYQKHMKDYDFKWGELVDKVQSLDSRLSLAAAEVGLLKENLAKCKDSGTAQNESEDP